jgi:Mechanosensitive ion channel
MSELEPSHCSIPQVADGITFEMNSNQDGLQYLKITGENRIIVRGTILINGVIITSWDVSDEDVIPQDINDGSIRRAYIQFDASEGSEIINSVISALIWGMAAAVAIGVGVGLAYGLREAFPAMIRGSTQIQPALKARQRVTIGGGTTTGTVQEAGSFSVILKDDQGRTIVIPTKNIIDKEIVIESGPAPAIQEKAVEENRGAGAGS